MDPTVAKRRYVLQVIELLPSFQMPTDDAAAQAGGVVAGVGDAALESPSPASAAVPPPELPRQQPPAVQQAARRLPRETRAAAAPPRLVAASRARSKQPVDALSYGVTVLQIVGFVALVGAFIFVATRVALPFCHAQIARHLGAESARALVKSLTPVFWFALGYLFVAAIRSRVRHSMPRNGDACSHTWSRSARRRSSS